MLIATSKKISRKFKGAFRHAAVAAGVSAFMFAESALASGTYDADKVNESTSGVSDFIRELIHGEVGYLFCLVLFVWGIFNIIKTKDLWSASTPFGAAIFILLVPDMLEGFFNLTS